MKTIQYQLSSHKCLEEGWTLRPPSPLFEGSEGTEMYEPDPVLPSWADAGSKVSKTRRKHAFLTQGWANIADLSIT